MAIFKVEDYYYHIPVYMINDIPLLHNAYKFESGKEIINTTLDIESMDIVVDFYNNGYVYCNILDAYHVADYFMYDELKKYTCEFITEQFNVYGDAEMFEYINEIIV